MQCRNCTSLYTRPHTSKRKKQRKTLGSVGTHIQSPQKWLHLHRMHPKKEYSTNRVPHFLWAFSHNSSQFEKEIGVDIKKKNCKQANKKPLQNLLRRNSKAEARHTTVRVHQIGIMKLKKLWKSNKTSKYMVNVETVRRWQLRVAKVEQGMGRTPPINSHPHVLSELLPCLTLLNPDSTHQQPRLW